MTIEEGYYSYLTSVSAITALVSTRVFPLFVPQSLAGASQDSRFPCLVYRSQLQVRGKSNAGTNGLNKTRIETHCWSTTDALAGALATTVISNLKNQHKTTWGTVKISNCNVESDDENLEQMVGNDGLLKFGVIFTASVWFIEQ
jgi:hypothetical protein